MKTFIYRTARELLVDTAGDDHALHTAVKCDKPFGGTIKFYCSCGAVYEVAATDSNLKALELVLGPGKP